MNVTRLMFVTIAACTFAACTRDNPAPPAGPVSAETAAMTRWQALTTEDEKLRAFIESRLEFMAIRRDALTSEEKVKLDAAATAYDEMKVGWREATSAFLAGDVTVAVVKGETARAQARETLRLLGIPID